MTDLYTAFRLAGILDGECVQLRTDRPNPEWDGRDYCIMTGKKIRDKYDMHAVKVTGIRPWFLCGDYEGFTFHVRIPENTKKRR